MRMKFIIFIYLLMAEVMVGAQSGLTRMVVGENHVATYEQRVGWIRKLDKMATTQEDKVLLLDFLTCPMAEGRTSEGELATLKNDTADWLMGRYPGDEEIYDVLFAALVAEDQGTIWPSYIRRA